MKKTDKILSTLLLTALLGTVVASCATSTPTKVGEVTRPGQEEKDNTATAVPEVSTQTEFRVGDVMMAKGLEIVYVASGEYVSDNQFLQPKDGYKYIYIALSCKNTSDSDKNISSFDFDCYADGYSADSYYGGDDALSATMSAGRTTAGKVYFEVPENAAEIEIEYSYDLFSDKKATFIYEGEKDSGYVAEADATASEDAFEVGDVIEASGLTISYLSCEEYKSDNQFIQPADGCQFVSCGFEFENTSNSDQMVSSFSFKCYANGKACDSSYARDDNLSTSTLSPGRKVAGTVTFEVPMDAETVELEYETNVWTSDHIVFTVR